MLVCLFLFWKLHHCNLSIWKIEKMFPLHISIDRSGRLKINLLCRWHSSCLLSSDAFKALLPTINSSTELFFLAFVKSNPSRIDEDCKTRWKAKSYLGNVYMRENGEKNIEIFSRFGIYVTRIFFPSSIFNETRKAKGWILIHLLSIRLSGLSRQWIAENTNLW